jgi:hypothetical protein
MLSESEASAFETVYEKQVPSAVPDDILTISKGWGE